MGNTHSTSQDGQNTNSVPAAAASHVREQRKEKARRNGARQSISLSGPSSAEQSDAESVATMNSVSDDTPHSVLVPGTQFGRYGSSDVSLVHVDATSDQDRDSETSLSGSDADMSASHAQQQGSRYGAVARRRFLQHDLNLSDAEPSVKLPYDAPTPRLAQAAAPGERLTKPDAPLIVDPPTISEPQPASPLQVHAVPAPPTPRAEQVERMPISDAAAIGGRRSFMLNEDALLALHETKAPVTDTEPSDDEHRRDTSDKLQSFPSYLKIPTAIPRARTDAALLPHLLLSQTLHSLQENRDAEKTEPSDAPSPSTTAAELVPAAETGPSAPELDTPAPPVPSAESLPMSPPRENAAPVPMTPVTLVWRGRGKQVYVTGTFADEWQSKIALRQLRPGTPFLCTLHLPPGTHRLKFVVDDRWRVSPDLDSATDGDGTLVNYVEIPNLHKPRNSRQRSGVERNEAWKRAMADLHTANATPRGEWDVLDDIPGAAENAWTTVVPPVIEVAQETEERLLEHDMGDDASKLLPMPPQLPRQLEKVSLNSNMPSSAASMPTSSLQVDDTSVLPAPNHAVLNHLATGAIRNGVLAMGTVTRYKNKVCDAAHPVRNHAAVSPGPTVD